VEQQEMEESDLPVVESLYGFPVLDPQNYFYEALYYGVFQPPTSTTITLLSPYGAIVFKGDFTVAGSFVTGGTVTGYTVFAEDTKVMKASGFDILAMELIDAVNAWQAFDFEPLEELLFAVPTEQVGSELDDYLVAGSIGSKAIGRQGDDQLIAAVGDVTLKGGKGNDLLLAGEGNAWLSGGEGKDVFAFIDPALASSKIKDFSVDDDLFMLNPFAFEGVPFGFIADDQFKIGKQASTPEQIIVFQKGKGRVFFDQDGSEAVYAPVQFAKVEKGLDLTAQHFYGELGGIA
jgi:Ca2+-binding RTX toxin-like protein